MESLTDYSRLSLNQITTESWSLRDAAEGCARAGIPWIAPWRHKVSAIGLAESKRAIRDAGLRVSSLCRGGMFPAATQAAFQERMDDNRRAVEEAAELGADVLVLVCGPADGQDLASARAMVKEGVSLLTEFAEDHGVKLAVEPLHPMYCAERSVIVTLEQALDLAVAFPARQVGVVVDVFHVWWDPALYAQIKRAAGRILGYHVSDWIVPTPDMLHGRGMMGDGVIDLRGICAAVEEAGYTGPIEVEIFNRAIWDQDGNDVLQTIKERFRSHV